MEAALDYRNVDSIGHSRIMASINKFAEHTVDFLNRFSNICDLKLLDVSHRISKVEVLTTLLEKNLTSVSGLNFVPGEPMPVSSAPPPPSAPEAPAASAGAGAPTTTPEAAAPAAEETVAEEEAAPEEPEEQAYNPRNDPAYAHYFKLKDIGVPVIAFAPKMIAEGLDPDVLKEAGD